MPFLESMGIRFSQNSPNDDQTLLHPTKRQKSRSTSPRRPSVTEQLKHLQQPAPVQQPIHTQNLEPRPDSQPQQQQQQQPMPYYIHRQPSNQHLYAQAPAYTGVQRPRTTSFPPQGPPGAPQQIRQTWAPGTTTVPTIPQPVTQMPTGAPMQPVGVPQQNPPNLRPLDPTDDNDPRLPPRPYPNSYWATPQLLASEYPTKGPQQTSIPRLDRLLSLGVVDFIDLTEPGEGLPSEPYALNMLPWIARKKGLGMVRMARMHESHGRHRRSFSAGVVPGQMTGAPGVPVHQQLHPHLLAPEDIRGRTHSRFPSDPSANGRPHRTGVITGEEGADWAVPVTRNTIRVAQYPIRDTTLPDPRTLSTILTALAHSQAQGRRAVVHCNGGYGRTGTIVGCWYVHSGVAQAATVYYPGQFLQYRLPSGQIQLVPYYAKRNAGERALDLLAKKWKGVEKSRTGVTTPGNQLQMDFVKAFKPPPAPPGHPPPQPQMRHKTSHPPTQAPPLRRSRTGRI